LKAFVAVVKDWLKGQENSVRTLEQQPSVHKNPDIQELLKAIPQAHVNELEYVIEELERIISEG
jgi:hypothetical protein